MTSRARSAALGAAILAALAAGALVVRHHRAPGPAAGDADGAGSGSKLPGDLAPGAQRRWRLSFEARMAEKRGGAAEPMTMRLTGQWVVTVVGTRPDGYDVACEVVAPKVGGGGVAGVTGDEVAALERRMARRFFVSYRADGAALEIYFPRDVDPGARNLLQLIATDTQLVRPVRKTEQWTAVERDGAGGYLAAYHEVAPGQLVKTKLKYLDTNGAAGPNGAAPKGVDVVIDASTRRLTLDAQGGLVAFEGGDTMRIDLPMSSGAVSMRVSARLDGLVRARAPELVGALVHERQTFDRTGIVTHALSDEQAQAQRDRELVAGANLDAVLDGVRAARDDGRAAARLEAWLRLHPEALTVIARAVRAAPTDPATKTFLQAAGRAGTPAAQAALCALAGANDLRPQTRGDALVALVAVKRPSAETTRAVRALLDVGEPVVRRAARFVSGSLAHAVREALPAEADALDAALLARQQAATDQLARLELIDAMGNSAGPRLFPGLEAALRDADAPIRAAAAGALRLYGDDAARALLARAITGDRDPSVRAAAIIAAGFAFDPRYVEPLTKAALGDAAEFVRSDAASLLGNHQDDAPDLTDHIKDTLTRVATRDPKPAVRREARAALDRAAAR